MSDQPGPTSEVDAVREHLAQLEGERALVRALEIAVSRLAANLDRQAPGVIAEVFGPVARRTVDAGDSTFQAFLDGVDAKLRKMADRAEVARDGL